jgi:hypothetical protein
MTNGSIINLKGREYLLNFTDITNEILDAHLTNWKSQKKNSIDGPNGVFRAMLTHAQNRQGMPNTIGGNKGINKLEGLLYGFSPKKVIAEYQNWERLIEAIQETIEVPGRGINPNNPRSHWVVYTKSILSCAHFLNSFETIDSFNDFVERFYCNEYSKLALPLLLEKELFGFGFALACDFLKDNGYPEFVKPDVHVNAIARGVGITQATSDYGVFKDIINYCKHHNLIPYEFDKLLWLIGSGNFHLNNIQVMSHRDVFIKQVNSLSRE